MKNFLLIDYLKNTSILNKDEFEFLKHELDKKLYAYGDHFRINTEKSSNLSRIKSVIKNFIELNISLIKKREILNNTIISNAYFNFSTELSNLNYNVISVPWKWNNIKNLYLENYYDIKLINIIKKIKHEFSYSDFNKLVLDQSFKEVLNIYMELINDISSNNKIKAYFAPFDLMFFERTFIKSFNRYDKPTFICDHGISGRYNNIDDNSSKYLIVFGEKLKENYIKVGVDKNKILVTGHPYYKNDISKNKINFNFDNILVLTKPVNSFPPSVQENYSFFSDRSRSILYLYSIQQVLKKLGIKKARLRPHPSENKNWYMKFIDTSFFVLDNFTSIKESIQKSTLLIGPSSTVFFESLYYGVNYIIYEPTILNKDLIDLTLLPPFDKSDKRIKIMQTEEELKYVLKEKETQDLSFFSDYIKVPFDINFMKNLI